MKKFKFRLQSVLEAREKKLEDCQLELAKVQSVLRQQTDILDKLYQTQINTKKNLESQIDRGANIDFTLIVSHRNYIDKLSTDIQNQHKIISDTEVIVEEKKEEVVEALKAKTMIEKLKEKDKKIFFKEFDALQSKEIDEIALTRHGKSF